MWTFFGLILAALLHASINIFAALGGQAVAIVMMMGAWSIFIFFLIRPESSRPYGTIIREVDLLRQIAHAEENLHSLESTGQAHAVVPLPSVANIINYLKRFAKR